MIGDLLALMPEYLAGHVRLALAALIVGVAVSVPLGITAARRPRLGRIVVSAAGVIQTIPGLALLAVMVPLLAALSLPGIGFLPAFLGLTLYGILPILNNTVTGLQGVDPDLVEAARGVGMTPSQQLRRVELPLALPVIVTGIRTATVWLVGMATLSTPVGATSLGNYIFSGLQTRNYASVLVGCLGSAALALMLDGVVRLAERAVRRGHTRQAGGVAAAATAVALAGSLATMTGPDSLVVGAKTFTEQYVLAEVISQRIRNETGEPARQISSLGSTVAFDALRDGEIDLYVDYSGTVWSTILREEGVPPGRDEVLATVGRRLASEHGVHLVAALGFENTYALAMRRDRAEALGVRKISDLKGHAPTLSMGGDYEFFARPEWVAVRDAYDLSFREKRSMDASLMYSAVETGEVDIISAFSTDGRIEASDLVILEDDAAVIPPYDAIVLASDRATRTREAELAAVRSLAGTIDGPRMRAMNHAVDAEGRSPARVARAFLAGLDAGSP